MTKEKFLDSRKYCNLHYDFEDYLFGENEWGWVYDGSCYIEDTKTWSKVDEGLGRWHLVLENHYYYSDDLKELEELLWNWAKGAVYGIINENNQTPN
jgi:hypothetical protein